MNNTKRKIKKSVKIYFFIALGVIILVIAGIIYFKTVTSIEYKLKKLGYTKEEVKTIIDKTDENKILKMKYSNKLVSILNAKWYLEKHLDDYLKETETNPDLDIDSIITQVNTHTNTKYYSLDLNADTSLNSSMLVNKYYILNKEYTPENIVDVSNWYSYAGQKLNQEAYDQYKKMFNAAKKENLTIIINDSYRSYEQQEKSYDRYNDDFAAKPGYSEHQTGYAVDVISPNSDSTNFKDTDEYRWLQNNSYLYGYILRYPEGKEKITGYEYESWHYRYLGVDLATKVHDSGLTYDEYYAYYIEK